MSFGDYLFGVVGLAAVAIPMGLAAIRLRRRLLPGWEGAPARLAEAVLGVALATVLLQLLGAFGILVPAVLIVAALVLGLGLYFGPWLRVEATDTVAWKDHGRRRYAALLRIGSRDPGNWL